MVPNGLIRKTEVTGHRVSKHMLRGIHIVECSIRIDSVTANAIASIPSIKVMESKTVFPNLFRLVSLIVLFTASSCERLAGPESRELAGGYRLKRVRGSNDFALIIPNETGGQIVDEIGWRKPLIIARGSGSRYWEVINTARAQHTRMSDESLKADSTYQSIEVVPADKAWATLKPGSKIW